MFGYITVNEPDLRIREYNLYRAYYCGVCRDLHSCYGRAGQMTLSYDTTFLALLLTSLYEPEETRTNARCIVHPLSKHPARQNAFTRYAADVNVILSYYSCLDNWEDEHQWRSRIMALILSGASRRAGALHEEKAAVILDSLEKLRKMEQSGEKDLDSVSGCFGNLMAEILDCKGDHWSAALRQMGFFLGKFIYLMDAYDDLDKDLKSGSYNPLASLKDRPDFDEYCRDILTMMMAESCRAFEMLPIVENVDILRNIMYSGVWTKFEEVCEKRKEAGKINE